ncbi:MAG: anaerobic ribonucleoside-triphosphate reductase activating protein [Lachnospiraceae bacterium]|nr:anaerobic ribonucleoside-triphosphate reductase activating protein [Lachnospiraceae bacterium]
MRIHGFNKTTLLDYPGHLAATIFLGNCNFRCPFCHNSSLVLSPDALPEIDTTEVLQTLKKRSNILEGVCITGGEPTLQKELPDFIREIKALGLKVKLDTNGTNPKLIDRLFSEELIDYVAMDIKNSRDKYLETAGIMSGSSLSNELLSSVMTSVELLMQQDKPYEFRTTIVHELHTKEDIRSIGEWLEGCNAYFLQAYEDSGNTIRPGFTSPSPQELLSYKEILIPFIPNVSIRGVDL